MKLAELKKKTYVRADVTTTRQLKAKFADIKPLDMRYTASWEKALAILKSAGDLTEKAASGKSSQKNDLKDSKLAPERAFEDWLDNPPGDLKDLFAEADSALNDFDDKLKKAERLTKVAKTMAGSLDEFAEASLSEAQQLAKAATEADDLSRQANLN